MSFVHLHNHSQYSLLDGMSRPDEMAQIVKENGQFAAAITDHGSMAGTLSFQKACKKYGVKPIHGVEAYYVPSVEGDDDDKSRERFHLIVLAKNDQGLEKLFKVQQRAWTESFYYKPRIEYSDIEYMAGDVVVLSGCMASQLCRLLEHDKDSEAETLARTFQELLGKDYFIEVQPWNHGNLNPRLLSLADSLNIPVVGTLDCHYPTKEDRGVEEVLLMMGQLPSLKVADDRHAKEMYDVAAAEHDLVKKMNILYPNRFLRFEDISPFLMSNEEVVDIFSEAGITREDIFSNSLEIAERCTSEIKTERYLLPKFSDKFDSGWYLREIAEHGLQELGLNDDPRYVEALDMELSIIDNLKFNDYFLIVWDICAAAKRKGIALGPGRGSVGGSLLAYCLGITKVDPIKYNLLFARFLNPERVSPPDIDLDFEDKRRVEMKEYASERWGKENTASISTFGEFKPKDLIKKILSVYRVPFKESNTISPLFDTLEQFKTNERIADIRNEHPTVIEIAERLENRVHEAGAHAAGVVISQEPLWKVAPIETRNLKDEDERLRVIAYDMNEAEELGLWKFDFLGVKALAVVNDCIDIIKTNTGVDVEKLSLGLDDINVIKAFNTDSLVGIFQAEGSGYKKLVSEMRIDSFADLVASNALVRPGASVTQGAKYIERKFDPSKIEYPHESLKPILEETYGTFVYQEQLMQTVVALADFTWGEADYLRKIIGKKRDSEEFDKFSEKFVLNAGEKVGQSVAVEMWADFQKASLYMFNKSHSVGYSMLSYQTMWLKHHYPKEFIWACLTNETKPEDISTFLNEAGRLGINVLGPDVNLSRESFTLDKDGIRFGIGNINGAGVAAVKEIMAKQPFSSHEHFVGTVKKSAVKQNLLDALEKIGAFESLGHDSGYDTKKYYLPVLNWSKYAEEDQTFKDLLTPIGELSANGIHVVRGLIKSVKRTQAWFRVEMEDSTGTTAFFVDDKNASIKKKDYIIALVSGNSMYTFADPNADESDPFIAFLLKSNKPPFENIEEHFKKGKKWFEGIIISYRSFTTKSGVEMATVVVWIPKLEVYKKLTLFSNEFEKFQQYLSTWEWVVIDPGSNNTINNLISSKEFGTMKELQLTSVVK